MAMVRPVVNKDPFAGVGMTIALTFSALKKLSLGERPKGEELQSITETVAIIGSLLITPNIFSEVGRRSRLFWAVVPPQSIKRDALELLGGDLREVLLGLDSGTPFDDLWSSLLKRAQDTVLALRLGVYLCRR